VVSDVHNGSVVTTLPIGARVDGVGFDAAKGLAFSSNGEGTLTAVREDSPAKFSVVGNVPTALGARTPAFDPASRRIFLSTAQFRPLPDSTAAQPRPRRPMLPGSFQRMVRGE
jgi:hypothetical protein